MAKHSFAHYSENYTKPLDSILTAKAKIFHKGLVFPALPNQSALG
jgi:hypothetical protein